MYQILQSTSYMQTRINNCELKYATANHQLKHTSIAIHNCNTYQVVRLGLAQALGIADIARYDHNILLNIHSIAS